MPRTWVRDPEGLDPESLQGGAGGSPRTPQGFARDPKAVGTGRGQSFGKFVNTTANTAYERMGNLVPVRVESGRCAAVQLTRPAHTAEAKTAEAKTAEAKTAEAKTA